VEERPRDVARVDSANARAKQQVMIRSKCQALTIASISAIAVLPLGVQKIWQGLRDNQSLGDLQSKPCCNIEQDIMGDKVTVKKLSGIFLSPDLSIESNLERCPAHF
jgi:hypothetical protein